MATFPLHQSNPLRWADANSQAVLEAAPDAMLVINRAGEILAVNLQAEKLYGFSREQLIGKVVESLIPERFRDRHRQHREHFLANPKIQFMQVPGIFALRSNTNEFPVDVSLSRLTVGTEILAISAIRDTTERVRAEELRRSEAVLRESEERFRLVADTAPVLIRVSGIDKLCTYCNKSWLDFTGRSIEEELGNGWTRRVHPEDLQRCLDSYTRAFDRREPYTTEYRLRRHDGEFRWVLHSGMPRVNRDNSFAGYIVTGVDITERKLAEDRLREYERAVESAEEMIAVVDREYRILIANRKYATMRNMPKEQVVGHFTHEVLNKEVFESVVKPRLDECFQGKVVRYEMKYTYPDLGERDVSVSYFPIEGATGVEGAACIFQDITERKRAEEALLAVNRRLIEAQEQERARIARELHDDINQRLALLAVELEASKKNPPNSAGDMSRLLTQVQERIAGVSTEVQSISHQLHSSQLEYLGIVAAMMSFCKEFAARQTVEIDFKNDDIPQPVSYEVSLCLFRVLQEALQNAAKHSKVRHFEVKLGCSTNELHLTVSDRGAGFDIEAAKQGRGLGLTSMKERTRLVNGTIAIESKPMAGTTIHVRVPLGSELGSQRAAG
jgi:PAS domain S-box-containing protein